VLTETDLRQRERANRLTALNQAGWKIKGPDGAAERLGLKPTTLLARMKKMSLTRPPKPNHPPAPQRRLKNYSGDISVT
jgi:transcriptional regulator with GAF, ATPase, and Fis domain